MSLDHLERRLRHLESRVDIDKGGKHTASQSLQLLTDQLSKFSEEHDSLKKLFQHLNNANVEFHLDHQFLIDEEELEKERQVVYARFDDILMMVERLAKIQNIMKKDLLEFDTTILEEDLGPRYQRLKDLELKYTSLLVRSIAVLQNFLTLQSNVNNFHRGIKASLTAT